jgi:MtrB/PioB family decaheme-associated outer membrane protein
MTKRDMNVTGGGGRLLLAVLGLPFSTYAAADGTTGEEIPAGVDISGWVCEYCAFEKGFSGEVEAGAGYVSDDSFKFGEYNGLHDEGPFAIGNASARYRDEDADYLDLRARDLGLDTRSLDVEGGRQGKYKLFLKYHEIPHYISDSASTPYLGNGHDTLQLPPGWTPAGSTAGMTDLAASLHEVDLKTERKRLEVGAAFIPASKWETAINVRHEIRDGQKATAGSFFFNAAQLVEPVDYVTDEVEVSATYTTQKWQTRLAYYGSFFNNHDDSLVWQNAYNPIVPGADAGQLAMPPDNQFHQVLLSSGYQLTKQTRVSGDIALGRMEQNEDLLAATINPNLAVALPEQSAHARVDTLTANLKVNSTVTDKLRLNAAYRYNDRNNKTPSEVWDWVTTDAFVSPSRSNLPYSFTDITAGLGADYRLTRVAKLSGGYDYAKKERTNQEVNHTTEDTFWGKVSVHVRENFDVDFGVAHADRTTSAYHPVAETQPPENPLLRKFNLADRKRNTGSVHAAFTPHERISIGLGVELSKDDYENSVLGLTQSTEADYNADASVILTEATSLHVFAGWQQIQSDQAGSQTFSTPDWFASNDDVIKTVGIGVKHQLIKDKLDVGADFVMSRSTGQVDVQTGAPDGEFPDLKTDLDTLKLYGDYRLKENLTLHAAYWFEHYNSKDWMLDGVYPDTIPNVIAFGEQSPHYDVHAVMMSARYRF